MTVRTVTGDIEDIGGGAVANGYFWVVPVDAVRSIDADTVGILNKTRVTADGSGDFSVDLQEGEYFLVADTTAGALTARFVVDSTGPWTIGRLMGLSGPVAAGLAAQIFDAANRAQAWAESPTPPDPDDATSKSAKTWAGEAEATAETLADLATLEGLVTDAQTAESNAEGFATQAETARDATVLAAAAEGVYADTTLAAAITAGLAAVADGGTFYATGDDVDYIGLYEDDAGSAVEIGRTLAGANYVGFSEWDDWAWAVADPSGYVATGVRPDGSVAGQAPAQTDFLTGGVFDYDINHFFVYGQSLSIGQSTPVVSTAQKYDNIMFTRGMRPHIDHPAETAAEWYAAFVPAVEKQSPTNVLLAETPAMGAGDMIKERILADYGLAHTDMSYQIALSAPGLGAQTIAQLDTGSNHYNRMLGQAEYGAALAAAADKTYAVQAVGWVQGESDYVSNTPRATYLSLLNALIADFNTDIKTETGQTKDIPLIMGQCAAHVAYEKTIPTIALAQADAEAANSLAYIACAMYQFEYQGLTDVHLSGISSRWFGAYLGLAYERIVIQGLDWKPLKPIASSVAGNIAHVKFNVPSGRLQFDTVNVEAQTNYGLQLVDSSGSPLSVSSVTISAPDTVKFVTSGNIPVGSILRPGWLGDGGIGRFRGPRTNLRDDQGDTIRFDRNGINLPMHNWCLISEWSL